MQLFSMLRWENSWGIYFKNIGLIYVKNLFFIIKSYYFIYLVKKILNESSEILPMSVFSPKFWHHYA
jgi:hypothetical protein